MLSPKVAQCFAHSINFFEVRGQDDWRKAVEEGVEAAVEKSAHHACLRCTHACICVEAWDAKNEMKVSIVHRGCARCARLEPIQDYQNFSLDADYFWCPWEERTEAAGGSDE